MIIKCGNNRTAGHSHGVVNLKNETRGLRKSNGLLSSSGLVTAMMCLELRLRQIPTDGGAPRGGCQTNSGEGCRAVIPRSHQAGNLCTPRRYFGIIWGGFQRTTIHRSNVRFRPIADISVPLVSLS